MSPDVGKALVVGGGVGEMTDEASPIHTCPECRHQLIWSDYSEGAYNKGWLCHNFSSCGHQRSNAGDWRWFCQGCSKDFCSTCKPGQPGWFSQKDLAVACSSCGHAFAADARFCTKCGKTREVGEAVTLSVSGKIGIRYERDTGCVSEVKAGGAARKLGVQVGWIIVRLDGSPYSDDLLNQKIAGGNSYQITFTKVESRAVSSVSKDVTKMTSDSRDSKRSNELRIREEEAKRRDEWKRKERDDEKRWEEERVREANAVKALIDERLRAEATQREVLALERQHVRGVYQVEERLRTDEEMRIERIQWVEEERKWDAEWQTHLRVEQEKLAAERTRIEEEQRIKELELLERHRAYERHETEAVRLQREREAQERELEERWKAYERQELEVRRLRLEYELEQKRRADEMARWELERRRLPSPPAITYQRYEDPQTPQTVTSRQFVAEQCQEFSLADGDEDLRLGDEATEEHLLTYDASSIDYPEDGFEPGYQGAKLRQTLRAAGLCSILVAVAIVSWMTSYNYAWTSRTVIEGNNMYATAALDSLRNRGPCDSLQGYMPEKERLLYIGIASPPSHFHRRVEARKFWIDKERLYFGSRVKIEFLIGHLPEDDVSDRHLIDQKLQEETTRYGDVKRIPVFEGAGFEADKLLWTLRSGTGWKARYVMTASDDKQIDVQSTLTLLAKRSSMARPAYFGGAWMQDAVQEADGQQSWFFDGGGYGISGDLAYKFAVTNMNRNIGFAVHGTSSASISMAKWIKDQTKEREQNGCLPVEHIALPDMAAPLVPPTTTMLDPCAIPNNPCAAPPLTQ